MQNDINFAPDDFEFIQRDMRISDKKLETKPTTFFKDAIKRFKKNKSSVVGGIVMSILILLAIIVPEVLPYDIDNVHTTEKHLPPKLFKAGTGFWDGTRKYERIIYDTVDEVPALNDNREQQDGRRVEKYSVNALKESLIEITVDTEPSLIDNATPYGKGGYVMFEADVKLDNADKFMRSKITEFTAEGGYTLDMVFGDEDNIGTSRQGQYRVFLEIVDEEDEAAQKLAEEQAAAAQSSGDDGSSEDGGENIDNGFGDSENDGETISEPDTIEIDMSAENVIMIRDFSSDYSALSFNISDALKEKGIDKTKARIVFEIKSSAEAKQYVLIESLKLSAVEKVKNQNDIDAISFEDATQMVVNADKASVGYWACSGRKGVHNSIVYYCDFILDPYNLAYGMTDEKSYAKSELDKWIANEWCSFEYYGDGEYSFEALTDDCPIVEITGIELNSRTKKVLNVVGRGWKYKELGYSKMPNFLLGTNDSGQDMFKKAFAGLRTSLILGVCTAAFCFAFGLVWGAISGYFGGWTDLIMARFCEILSGVPWIVVMTLAILHLGNNFFTFFLALCLTGWIGTAGRTRTQFYRFKNREYVYASRTLGAGNLRLIFRHILPNSIGTIITSSVLMIPSVIFSEASLAYLKLGLQGTRSFGTMMAANQQYLDKYPYLVIFPAIVIALMMISFNLFGNGLRDAFNPSLKGSE